MAISVFQYEGFSNFYTDSDSSASFVRAKLAWRCSGLPTALVLIKNVLIIDFPRCSVGNCLRSRQEFSSTRWKLGFLFTRIIDVRSGKTTWIKRSI